MGTPHITLGRIGNKTSALLTAAYSVAASACSPSGETAFSRLSEQAQDLIVRAAMGEFNDAPPQNIPDDVKAEIAAWASEPDAENTNSPTNG